MRNTAGFTLPELVLTSSIIMILAGLAVPTLSRVKESGRNTVCKANLKNYIPAYIEAFEESARADPQLRFADTYDMLSYYIGQPLPQLINGAPTKIDPYYCKSDPRNDLQRSFDYGVSYFTEGNTEVWLYRNRVQLDGENPMRETGGDVIAQDFGYFHNGKLNTARKDGSVK